MGAGRSCEHIFGKWEWNRMEVHWAQASDAESQGAPSPLFSVGLSDHQHGCSEHDSAAQRTLRVKTSRKRNRESTSESRKINSERTRESKDW